MAMDEATRKQFAKEWCRRAKLRMRAKALGLEGPPFVRTGVPILLTDPYPTQAAKKTRRGDMTPEELLAHTKEISRQAGRRRCARIKAARLGLEGPPLLIAKPTNDDTVRAARHAEREKQRRLTLGESLREIERLRSALPENRAKQKIYGAANYRANKLKVIAQVIDWRRRNPEKCAAYAKTTRANLLADPIRVANRNATRLEWERQKMAEDLAFRMLKRLRSALNQALRLHGDGRKTVSTRALIGCTMAELVVHIEAQFRPGMTWKNRGRQAGKRSGWEIDHIIPCAAFDMTQVDQQMACFHYSNLQPLWWFENLAKSARLDWQPEAKVG